jgi:ubiquinone/menaquinone biosynthesis C-methylase UbiE
MLDRVLEPEVMGGADEVMEYDAIDHQQVNIAFAEDFLRLPSLGPDCLDLGTGTALIPIEICRRSPSIRVMGADASIAMLDLARYHIDVHGMLDRIQLIHADAKHLIFEDAYFDSVVSNSLVHHLPDPSPMIREAWRVLRPQGWLFIRDLCRPSSMEEVEMLVATYAAGETPFSQQLLRQSLVAALNLAEIRAILDDLSIASQAVQMTSDRHWTLQVQKSVNAGNR